MSLLPRLLTILKALRELGPTQVSLLALYKLGLKSGHYRRSENAQAQPASFNFPLPLPKQKNYSPASAQMVGVAPGRR